LLYESEHHSVDAFKSRLASFLKPNFDALDRDEKVARKREQTVDVKIALEPRLGQLRSARRRTLTTAASRPSRAQDAGR
jgi:hypothetical protein